MKSYDHHNRTGQGTGSSGFTLMEVALAVVVVAIGMMAAFSLISTGLDSSAKAVNMTRAAIFADDVFNGLRSQAFLASDAGAGEWERFWTDFMDGRAAITVAAGPMWQLDVRTIPGWPPIVETNYAFVVATRDDDEAESLSLTNYCQRTDELTDIPNSALRYTLYVEPSVIQIPYVTNPDTTPPTLGERPWTNKVRAVLNVWEGQYGNAELADAITFATEFKNAGGL